MVIIRESAIDDLISNHCGAELPDPEKYGSDFFLVEFCFENIKRELDKYYIDAVPAKIQYACFKKMWTANGKPIWEYDGIRLSID